VQPIFTASCTAAGCHSGALPKENLDLTAGKAWGQLVNIKTNECSGSRIRVVPKDPSTSYLVDKLLGVDLCFGSQMPKLGQTLPNAQLQTISNWICEGAPNN